MLASRPLPSGAGAVNVHRWPSHLPFPGAFSPERCPGRKGGGKKGKRHLLWHLALVLGVALDYPPVTCL